MFKLIEKFLAPSRQARKSSSVWTLRAPQMFPARRIKKQSFTFVSMSKRPHRCFLLPTSEADEVFFLIRGGLDWHFVTFQALRDSVKDVKSFGFITVRDVCLAHTLLLSHVPRSLFRFTSEHARVSCAQTQRDNRRRNKLQPMTLSWRFKVFKVKAVLRASVWVFNSYITEPSANSSLADVVHAADSAAPSN